MFNAQPFLCLDFQLKLTYLNFSFFFFLYQRVRVWTTVRLSLHSPSWWRLISFSAVLLWPQQDHQTQKWLTILLQLQHSPLNQRATQTATEYPISISPVSYYCQNMKYRNIQTQKHSKTYGVELWNCVFIQVKENADAQVRMVKLTSVQRKKPKQTTMRYYDRDDDITHSRLHQLSFSSVLSLFLQCGDEGIFWQVNFERFHLHFRDQAIISAVSCKLDQVTI